MRTVWGTAVVATFAGVLLGAGTAHAAASALIAPIGFLVQGGIAVRTAVQVMCDPVGGVDTPLEAMLFLTQDDQTISGDGVINGIVCDGQPRWRPVRVTSFEGTFHRGRSRASAFVLICDEEGSTCEQAQAVRRVALLHSP